MSEIPKKARNDIGAAFHKAKKEQVNESGDNFLSRSLETIKECKRQASDAYNILENLIGSYSEYEELTKIELFYKDYFKINVKQFKEMIKAITLNEELGCVPKSAEEFVTAYIKRFEIEIDLRNNFKSTHPKTILDVPYNPQTDDDDFLKDAAAVVIDGVEHDSIAFNKMCLFAEAHKLRYSEGILNKAWSIAREMQHKNRMLEIYNDVMYKPQMTTRADDKTKVHRGTLELEKLMRAVVDPQHTDIGRATNVMQMFMWQVKNKMRNKNAKDHIMPVFVGEQNSGKSTLIRKLCEPLADAWNYSDFKQIVDDRNNETFAIVPVIVLDEMGYANVVDMGALKRILTSPFVKYRPLYTNSHKTVPMKSTFIGASNKDLSNIIYDPTGIRRFFQITTLPVMDFSVINEVDYQLIWRAVNEKDGSITGEELAAIQKDQEAIRPHDIYEDWLLDVIMSPKFRFHYDEKYTAKTLFEDFVVFADTYTAQANKGINMRTFGNNLSELTRKPRFLKVFQKSTKRSNAGNKYFFIEDGVNSCKGSCSLFDRDDAATVNILNLKDYGRKS